MSIRTASEGILKTHVTWEEFEENLTNALNTTARFGPNKSALDIGEGNGFASRCGLIDCDWQGEGAEKLPKRVVLKMGSCLAIVALSEMMPDEQNMFKDATPELWDMIEMNMKAMHNTECDSYDFMGQFGDTHAFPKIYYSKSFNDEICMEYVENGRMMNFSDKATLSQMKQIARALGRVQAESTKYEVMSESLKSKDIFGEFFRSTPKEQFMSMFSAVKFIEGSLKESVEKMEEILEKYYGSSLPSNIHTQLGFTPVLVNGGEQSKYLTLLNRHMRTENILLDKDSGDLRALIDWQCTHFGVGVEDLLRLSFFAQTTKDRRESAGVLVEEMYNALVANLGTTPAPYTLKQLKEVYDILFPHCALFFASGLGALLPANMPQPGDSDEKKAKWDVVLDKARGVLEDIVSYHDKNKSSNLSVSWFYPAA